MSRRKSETYGIPSHSDYTNKLLADMGPGDRFIYDNEPVTIVSKELTLSRQAWELCVEERDYPIFVSATLRVEVEQTGMKSTRE